MKNRNRNKTSLTVLLVSLALALGMWIGTKLSPYYIPRRGQDTTRNFALRKINYAMDLVGRQYVDSIQYDTLVDRTLTALLYSLDPHSTYLTQSALAREDEALSGKMEGIGVLLSMQDDTARIVQVFPGSPAAKTDLRPGDAVLAVDGDKVAHQGLDMQAIVDKIRGPRHSSLQLTVKRYGQAGRHKVNLRRGAINTPSVDYAGMLTDTIGYLCISSFTMTTASEYDMALVDLKKKGMKHLILDLRDNGGGLMSAAEGVADELLPGNELIVYMQGAHQKRQESRSGAGGLFCQGGVTVLINEHSASASEIVTGAIQDNDRGLVAGRRSFGKGLVQNQFILPDQSALQLTTARYYTPSGRCIQRAYDHGSGAYMMEYLMRLYDTENDTVSPSDDTTRYYTNKGRVVYGGGGIAPDYVLPVVTDKAFVYYNQLQRENIYTIVALDYVARHWTALQRAYATSDAFVKNFQVSPALFDQLLREGDAHGIARDPVCLAKYGDDMRVLLKATVATSLYGTPARSRILLHNDNEVQQTLQFILGGSKLPAVQAHAPKATAHKAASAKRNKKQ